MLFHLYTSPPVQRSKFDLNVLAAQKLAQHKIENWWKGGPAVDPSHPDEKDRKKDHFWMFVEYSGAGTSVGQRLDSWTRSEKVQRSGFGARAALLWEAPALWFC